jgi:hypothetical protein
MAKEVEAQIENAAQVIGYTDGGYEWTTVHTEAADQVKFDTIGDTIIGIYAGHELIYPDPIKEPGEFFVQLKWTVPGGAIFMNAGYEMRKAYTITTYSDDGTPTVRDKIDVGSMTRSELMKLVDVGQASDMNSVRVDVATPHADYSA